MRPCGDLVSVCRKLTATVRKSQRLNSQLPGVSFDPEFVFLLLLLLYCILFCFQIDPTRTISAGKVNLGAFRTYPKVIQKIQKIELLSWD